ncbi:hypothetical protein ABZ807_31565 [Micromonospora sp. NPDC047548]|uniref:WD40 repeat domain-containing protein n=1 Tax=Micromonospora sp. NPDC047548 TaxID=3155624 RepID=UPI0033C3279D
MPGPRLVRLSGPSLIEPVTPLVTAKLPTSATALLVLPDGDTCVAATDYGLFVRSLSTGDAVRVKARGPVARLSLTADSRLVTAGKFDLLVWDSAGWTVTRRLAYKGRALTDVAATDEFVVAGGWDGAWVWDISTGRRRCALAVGEVMAVAVTVDGRHAVTVERNRRVVLWDLRRGTAVRRLRRLDPGMPPIDWTRLVDWDWELPLDEVYRATALVDPTVNRLVIADGQLAAGLLNEQDGLRPSGTTSRARVTAVRPADGLIAAAVDESIQLLNRDGELVAALGPTHTPVTALAFTPDGRLVSAQTSGNLLVWPVTVDQQHARHGAHTTAVWRTVIDRTGRYGRSIDQDGGTRLWDLRSGQCLTDAELDATLGQGAWFLPDGGASMVAEYGVEHRLDSENGTCTIIVEDVLDEDESARTKTVCCRNLPGGEVRWTWIADPVGEETEWWAPAWVVLPRHSDAVLVCTNGDDATECTPAQVVVLDQATGERRSQFEVVNGHDALPQTLPDGSVCLRYKDYSVIPAVLRLALLDWRAGTVEPYAELTECWNAMIDADGLIVAVVGNEVRLVEPHGGQPVARVAMPAEIEPWTLAISPDGRVILAGDNQGGVHILHAPPA